MHQNVNCTQTHTQLTAHSEIKRSTSGPPTSSEQLRTRQGSVILRNFRSQIRPFPWIHFAFCSCTFWRSEERSKKGTLKHLTALYSSIQGHKKDTHSIRGQAVSNEIKCQKCSPVEQEVQEQVLNIF